MRLLTLALLVLPLGVASAEAQRVVEPAVKASCRGGPVVAAETGPATGVIRKMGDLPPAAQIQTVWRQVDGCPTPVVLRDGIGANARSDDGVSGDAQMSRIQ